MDQIHTVARGPQTQRFVADDVQLFSVPNERGDELSALASSNGFDFDGWEIDWHDVWPFWMGAEIDGKMVAAVQVLPGKPVGRMEMLFVDPALGHKARGVCVRKLISGGIATLRNHGSQALSGLCPFELPGYRRVLEKMGGVAIEEGWIVLRRIT